MKIILLSTLGLLGSITAFSQMYVSPNSYVFVNDQFMYVKQDVNLQNSGNLFLRNNSQLLQGSSNAGTNSGAGKLSVFQEGTVNNFQYNYWCSPVGNASATVGNEPFGITMLHRPTGVTSSTPAGILATNNYNGTASPLAIAPYWIWRFVASNTYAQWAYVGSATGINAGEGFTMKGTSGTDATIAYAIENVQNNVGNNQRYDFRGKPNDGDMGVAVAAGNFTLVGNPYPSAIDLNAYLLDPANAALINGQAYFWEQVVVNTHVLSQYQGGYGVYNPVTGIYTPAAFCTYDNAGNQGVALGSGADFQRRFSPIGQGFMVMGTASGNVTMKNEFRVFVKEEEVNQSEFARGGEGALASNNTAYFPEIPNVAGTDYTQIKKGTAPYIRIHAMYNDNGVRPTTIAFLDTATDGFDYGAEGRSPSTEVAEFYYVLPDNPHEYVATTVKFNINKRIPVGFRCAAETNFKVQVKDIVGFNANQKVYLYDKQTKIYHDIKNRFFDMTLPAGNNTTRFEITFKNKTNNSHNSNNQEYVEDAFTIFQNNAEAKLVVYNTNNKEITSLIMYDITGKVVLERVNLGNEGLFEFSTANLNDGVYVIKVKTADNIDIDLNKKVIVSRR